MQLDQSLDVAAFSIRSVHEVSRLLEAEFHVVAATSPLPVALGRQTLLHFDGAAQFAKLVTCAICVNFREKIQKIFIARNDRKINDRNEKRVKRTNNAFERIGNTSEKV